MHDELVDAKDLLSPYKLFHIFIHFFGALGQTRTGTPKMGKDFKSFVSTDFTTRACVDFIEFLVPFINIRNWELSQRQVYGQVYFIYNQIV